MVLLLGAIMDKYTALAAQVESINAGGAGDASAFETVSLADLDRLYPEAAAKGKSDTDYRDRARKITAGLQTKQPGYYALWERFRAVTQVALERDFHALGVDFDWWKGESDVEHLIQPMVAELDAKGLLVDDQEIG